MGVCLSKSRRRLRVFEVGEGVGDLGGNKVGLDVEHMHCICIPHNESTAFLLHGISSYCRQ